MQVHGVVGVICKSMVEPSVVGVICKSMVEHEAIIFSLLFMFSLFTGARLGATRSQSWVTPRVSVYSTLPVCTSILYSYC